VANTRTAHGILGVDELANRLANTIKGCPVMIPVRVWPQFVANSDETRPVSMSWWLSSLVQRHLHQQTEDGKNSNENASRLTAIWSVMTMPSKCVLSPQG